MKAPSRRLFNSTTRNGKPCLELWVNDAHNPLKAHVWRRYQDGHLYYNQAINGRLFYRAFQRTRLGDGYTVEYYLPFVR